MQPLVLRLFVAEPFCGHHVPQLVERNRRIIQLGNANQHARTLVSPSPINNARMMEFLCGLTH
jgi:hypothetical protein